MNILNYMNKTLSKINLPKIAKDQNIELNLDHSVPWVSKLLEDLTSNLDMESKNELPGSGHLKIHLSMEKKTDYNMMEKLLIKGSIDLNYHTLCVKCLISMAQYNKIQLKGCFIPQELSNEPEFQDQDTIYTHDEVFDLYTFENKEVNLEEYLIEQIYLNISDIPIHSEDCLGLCQVCGINLNDNTCNHQGA